MGLTFDRWASHVRLILRRGHSKLERHIISSSCCRHLHVTTKVHTKCVFGKRVLRFPDAHLRFSWCFFFFSLEPKCLTFSMNSARCALFMDPQISFFNNFFIKNGSRDIIHTFKNYFVTMFSNFQFSAIFKWTLNTRLKLQCPHTDTWLPCSLEFNATPNNQ